MPSLHCPPPLHVDAHQEAKPASNLDDSIVARKQRAVGTEDEHFTIVGVDY